MLRFQSFAFSVLVLIVVWITTEANRPNHNKVGRILPVEAKKRKKCSFRSCSQGVQWNSSTNLLLLILVCAICFSFLLILLCCFLATWTLIYLFLLLLLWLIELLKGVMIIKIKEWWLWWNLEICWKLNVVECCGLMEWIMVKNFDWDRDGYRLWRFVQVWRCLKMFGEWRLLKMVVWRWL